MPEAAVIVPALQRRPIIRVVARRFSCDYVRRFAWLGLSAYVRFVQRRGLQRLETLERPRRFRPLGRTLGRAAQASALHHTRSSYT
jgi:hypothetical protein